MRAFIILDSMMIRLLILLLEYMLIFFLLMVFPFMIILQWPVPVLHVLYMWLVKLFLHAILYFRAYCYLLIAGTLLIYVFCGFPYCWVNQDRVGSASSTIEVKYRNMAYVPVEIMWLCWILSDSRIRCHLLLLSIAQNSIFHEHTKHVEIHCHFVCQYLQLFLVSSFWLLDLFTKTHTSPAFDYCLTNPRCSPSSYHELERGCYNTKL